METSAARRGRAYQCLRYYRNGVVNIDRKDRATYHILKHHMPLDRVPHFCRLCLFRSMDKENLVRHVVSYQRHISVARAQGIIDHSQYFITSNDPFVIGDSDMRALSKEESTRWFQASAGRRRGTTMSSHVTQDSADEEVYVATPVPYTPTHPQITNYGDVLSADPGAERSSRRQTSPACQQPTLPSQFCSRSLLPSTGGMVFASPPMAEQPELGQASFPPAALPISTAQPALQVPSFQPQGVVATSHLGLTGLPAAKTPTRGQNQPAASSLLATPVLTMPFSLGPASDSTPVQDEVNLLDQLLTKEDYSDPLLTESSPIRLPQYKRLKTSAQCDKGTMTTTTHLPPQPTEQADMIRAIVRAAKAIVEAIDRNSRSVRCQNTTIGTLATTMERLVEAVQAPRRPTPRQRSEEKQRIRSAVTKPRK